LRRSLIERLPNLKMIASTGPITAQRSTPRPPRSAASHLPTHSSTPTVKLRSGLWRLHHARYFMNDVHHHVGSDREENCEQSRERTNDGEGDAGWWRGESFDSDAQRHDLLLWGRNGGSLRRT
jgi:hypothetical protein